MIPASSQTARCEARRTNRYANAPSPSVPKRQQALFELPFVSASKRIIVQKLLYDNQLKLLPVYIKNKPVGGTFFHINGFA